MNLTNQTAAIAAGVIAAGWWTGFVAPTIAGTSVRREAVFLLSQQGYFAGVGRQHRLKVERSIRGDRIAWIDDNIGGQLGSWLQTVQALSESLRSELLLPLAEVEMMVSRYARGAGYARHVDQHRGVGARLLTVIWYLNPAWQPDHGGCLHVWTDEMEHILPPLAGRVVVMRADIPHAVAPSQQSRYAITSWLRRPTIAGLL